MRIKKLMSAALAVSMTASALLSTSAFQTFAADKAPALIFDIRSKDSNAVTVSVKDLAAGDVTVPVSIYVPSNPGVAVIALKLQINDGQVAEDGSFGNYGLYFSDGNFASPYCFDSNNEGDYEKSFSKIFAVSKMNISWIYEQEPKRNADSALEAGTTSWDSSVSWAYTNAFATANLVVPQNTPAGTYTLDVRTERYVNALSSDSKTVFYGMSACSAYDNQAKIPFTSIPLTINVVDDSTTTSETTTSTSEVTTTTETSTTPKKVTTTTETSTTPKKVTTTTETSTTPKKVTTTTETSTTPKKVTTTTETSTTPKKVTTTTETSTTPKKVTTTTETSTTPKKVTTTTETSTTPKKVTTTETTATEITTSTTTTETSTSTTTTSFCQTEPPLTSLTETTTNDSAWHKDYKLADGGHYMILADVAGAPGEEVEVPMYVYGDTGSAGISLSIGYDQELTLESLDEAPTAQETAYLGTNMLNGDCYPASALFISDKDRIAEDGKTVLVLTFTIPEDAKPGTIYKVKFEDGTEPDSSGYVTQNMIVDHDGNELDVTLYSGTITVINSDEICLNKTSHNFSAIGENLSLNLFNADGAVTWKSSDEKVATVDQNGFVTSVGTGSAVITATCNKADYTCSIMVGLFGDVDGNGDVDLTDAISALQAYTSTILHTAMPLTDEEFAIADVSGNGKVELDDAISINQYYTNTHLLKKSASWYELTKNPKAPDAP